MYTLFIVEDEAPTRNWLREHFEWDRLNIKVIGEADDGKTAILPISDLKPSLVISDIEMPDMDGITLAQKIRETSPETKIIFISAHDDVDYIRSALKVDAIDYIFKPIDFDELETVVKRVLNIIDKEQGQKSIMYDMDLKLRQSLPLLKEKFFISLISGWISSDKEIMKKLEFLDLDLKLWGTYCAFVLSVDDFIKRNFDTTEKDWQLTSFAIVNICSELIETSLKGYFFEYGQGVFVGILDIEQEDYEERLLVLAKTIKEMLKMYLDISVTIGVGDAAEKLSDISKSYVKAKRAAGYRFFFGKNNVITMDALEMSDENEYHFGLQELEKVEVLLKAADNDKILEELEIVFKGLLSSRHPFKVQYFRNVCLDMMLIASRVLMGIGINTEEDGFRYNGEHIYALETSDDLKNCVVSYYKNACALIAKKRFSKENDVVENIKKIINHRYNEDITIQDIASEIYLTSTYLCLIFKQETGETINDYLTRVRIEMAKKFMADKSKKFYDICCSIGYTNPSYFSRLFKKYTGLSPSEYREKVL